MPTFNEGIRTVEGENLFNRVKNGYTDIHYTRIVFSSLDLSGKSDNDISQLTDVQPQELSVKTQTVSDTQDDGETDIRAIATNEPLTAGVNINTYALYAMDDQKREVLFGVAVDNHPSYLPAHAPGEQIQYLTYDWTSSIKDTNKIEMTDPNDVIVTYDEFNRYRNSLASSANSYHNSLSASASDANSALSMSAEGGIDGNGQRTEVVSSQATSYTNSAAASLTSVINTNSGNASGSAQSVMNQANANMETNRVNLQNSINGLPNWFDMNWTRNTMIPSGAASAANAANNYTNGKIGSLAGVVGANSANASNSAQSAINQANTNMESNRVSLSNSVNGLPHWWDENWTRNNVAPSLATSARDAANGYTNQQAGSLNNRFKSDENNIIYNSLNLITDDTSKWQSYHLFSSGGNNEFDVDTVGRNPNSTYTIGFMAYSDVPCTLYAIENGVASYDSWNLSKEPKYYTGSITTGGTLTKFGFNIGFWGNINTNIHIKNIVLTRTTTNVPYSDANNGFSTITGEITSASASINNLASTINGQLADKQNQINDRPTWNDENYTRDSLQTLAQDAANGAASVATNNGNNAATNAMNQANNYTNGKVNELQGQITNNYNGQQGENSSLQNQITYNWNSHNSSLGDLRNDLNNNIPNLITTPTDDWVTYHLTNNGNGSNQVDIDTIGRMPYGKYYMSFDGYTDTPCTIYAIEDGVDSFQSWNLSTTPQHYGGFVWLHDKITSFGINIGYDNRTDTYLHIRHLTLTNTQYEVPYNEANRGFMQLDKIKLANNEGDAQSKSSQYPGRLFIYSD